MPKKLTVKSVKGFENAHPYSRKAHQVQRAMLREEKNSKTKNAKMAENNLEIEKYQWFREAIPKERANLTKEELTNVVQRYIDRNDEEIENINSTLRKGRPTPPRLTLLKALKKKEQEEFNHGFFVPDLTIAKNVKTLRNWKDDWNSIKLIKLIKIYSKDAQKEKEEQKKLNKEKEIQKQIDHQKKQEMQVD
ncbi:hypothetical protein BCR32DRAFT_20688 [Anaeromyces robustus]|uniref:Translation machinery-associated protein 16 n=1 Tax=Anaeromyces robustus TaxID=1754192 RepID=A0A1Y1X468_9FUNG|nr:hypothetical protein BCR32DRAFT_20688 [Anaeromyces robustus]|eukprot:ORX80583.1 hypothetical protein BCR32DRAFT_20688 [Anaeromyces robustus]